MPILLLKMPESFEEKNHKVRFIGCSAIPSHLHEQNEKRWNVPWHEVFGMTETGYDISMRVHEHDAYVGTGADRKSTRLNSSHVAHSYAVICCKKKKINYIFHKIIINL